MFVLCAMFKSNSSYFFSPSFMPTKFCTTVMISMEFQPDMPHSLPFYLLLINDLKLSKKKEENIPNVMARW